ncbi:52 kDa repressor of the inhibitor of the protein kinase-like [Hydra vulgaris]|uniref:52 kDa repressor of the inhibitor of the protein kinase-like n=1 Tax=Hydra vulgaris TaxID=6087 RepID=A0ABM4B2H7_HYDVU
MAGEYKGVASRIKALNHKAIFVHCASHRLSLVVAAACQVQKVKNLLGQVKEISYFFNLSPKRSNCLKKYLSPNQEKIIDTCRTRWVQKLRGVDVFFDSFIPIIHALEEMGLNESKEYNSETASKSSSFLRLLTDYSFIVSLVITKQLMDFFYAITVTLQTKSFDISQQCFEITNLKNLLLEIKNKIDIYHTEWYAIALSLAKTLDIQEVRPRLCNVQVYRDNYPTNTVCDYFKHSITSPLIEHLINELDNRFPENGMFVYKGLAAVPSTVLSRIQVKKPWKSDFYEFLNFYSSDMPHFTSIHAELDLWELFWKNQLNIPSTVAGTLKSIDMRGFPNIRTAFIILGTIPITTCECERSISVIRRLKTYSRSNMIESRFNSLALMSIHQEIFPDVERVIDIFSKSGVRRLDLAFI